MNIGIALKKIREDNNLTKEQLALIMECTTNTIYNLEQDRTLPNMAYITKIAKKLGLTDSYILFLSIDSGHAPSVNGVEFDQVKERMLTLLNKGNWIFRNKKVTKNLKVGENISFYYNSEKIQGSLLNIFPEYCIVKLNIKKIFEINKMKNIKHLDQ